LDRCADLAAEAPTAPKTSSTAAVTQIHTTLRTNGCKVALLAKRCVSLPKARSIDIRAEVTARVGLNVPSLSNMHCSYGSAADALPRGQSAESGSRRSSRARA
jgi:hypothetical protein